MKQKYMAAILLTWSLLLVACAQQKAEMVAEDQMVYKRTDITLEISKKDVMGSNNDNNEATNREESLRLTKQLTAAEEVSAVMDILNRTAYIKAKLEMPRVPDYEIRVFEDDSASSSFTTRFGLWLSTDQESYAVVDQTNYRHGRLSVEDSQRMIKLLE